MILCTASGRSVRWLGDRTSISLARLRRERETDIADTLRGGHVRPLDDLRERHQQDPDVETETSMIHVPDVEGEPVLEPQQVAAVDGCPAPL